MGPLWEVTNGVATLLSPAESVKHRTKTIELPRCGKPRKRSDARLGPRKIGPISLVKNATGYGVSTELK